MGIFERKTEKIGGENLSPNEEKCVEIRKLTTE